jgi:Carbohydrate-selective porin, OprB family
MSSAVWKSVSICPAIAGTMLLLTTGVMAAPHSTEVARSSVASNLTLNKVSGAKPVQIAATEPTSADDRSETDIVKPSDWQYKSLQGLATKYGCNANLNDKPVSQIEFARGLNACLNRVEPMLAQQPNGMSGSAPSGVTRADLEVLQRLTQEYRAQLAEIDGRLVATDKKVAQLQANQFSTTTKLKGEAIFNVTGALSGSNSNNTVFGDRVRLLFETSFSGKDRLWTRLATGNQPGINSQLRNGPTAEGAQVSEFNVNNAVGVDWLAYQFPVGNANVYIPAFNGIHADYAATYGSNFEDVTGGNGALSNFAESNPIYKVGGGAGIGTTLPLAERGLTGVSVGYLAGGAQNSPQSGAGLFNGDYSILGQLNFKLGEKFDAGLTYVNSYHTGSNPIYGFGAGSSSVGIGLVGTGLANTNAAGANANSYGASFVYRASDTLAFNGFVVNTNANKATIGNQNIWSYGAGVSLPNFDGKGNLIGLLVGAEPYVGGVGTTPYHLEGFYKYKYSDNLSITPGLIYLTAPNQSTNNGGALIGVIRTTFTF